MSQKNNVFFFSPGGYGPSCRLDFWAESMEVDEDFDEALDEYIENSNIDYGVYCISRERAEELLKELQSLLEEK